MIKFLHTGDVHLGLQFNKVSFHRDKAINRRNELWETFERIVDYTKDNHMDFLFITGDLFENKYFTLGDIKRIRDILGTVKDTNVFIIAGNHDYISNKSLYNKIEWPSNVFIFKEGAIEKIEFPKLNTIVYGYSWDRVEIRENLLLNKLDFQDDYLNKILLLHGDISNSSNYLPLNLQNLKDLNMDYIALGHIHKPEIIAENIAYCGSPEPSDFGEKGERGFIQGSISKGRTKVEFIPFSKRNFWYEEIIIDENMGYLDIVNLFKNMDIGKKDMDFYRINLKGYVQRDIDMDNLFKSVENQFYHLEIIDDTIPDYDLEALESAYSDSIIGRFIKAMKEKGLDDPIVKDSLYIGLEALLKGRVDL